MRLLAVGVVFACSTGFGSSLAEFARGAPRVVASAQQSGAPVDFGALALAPDDFEAEHALALHWARHARLEDAIAKLDELSKRANVGDYAPKLAKELVRCRAFLALRDKHFAELVALGTKCTFDYQGKKLITKIKSVEGGLLVLDENKLKVASLPFTALDPYVLARSFSKATTEGADGWARWYAYVLAGDEKAVKGLKGAPEIVELRADAESWYPKALQLGAAMEVVTQLVARGLPGDPAAAQACLDALRALIAEHGELAQIAKRKPALTGLARAALKRLFALDKVAEATAAKVEVLPDSRMRFTYEFEKKEEAADFVADHAYFSAWRTNLGELDTKGEPKFELKQGAAHTLGAGCWRHAFNFEGAISVKYDVGFEGLGSAKRSSLIMVAVNDDKHDSFVGCQGFGSLDARNFPTKFRKMDIITEGRAISEGAVYPIELEVKDGTATSRVSGKQIKQVESGPRTGGGVFFYVHTDSIVFFAKVVIEGKPDMAAVEARWSAKKLAELKL